MVRGVCLVGLLGGFLAISPNLRDFVVDSYTAFNVTMDANGPYSWVAFGFATFVVMLIYFSRGSAVR